MINFQEWVKTENTKTIIITCRDQDNTLEDLLNSIKTIGNTGHSFSIIVDPDEKGREKFEWDGDGTDHIFKIEVKHGL